MNNYKLPRIVIVTRPSPLEILLGRHGTRGQVEFYLRTRGQEFATYQEAHDHFEGALRRVVDAIPADERRVRVDRSELDRFLFAPDDLVVVVGQDGLVANVAKYLDEQQVIGVNSDPSRFDGVLCVHEPGDMEKLLTVTPGFTLAVDPRSMVVAEREDGQRLLALNEVFVGHRSHQSARYTLRVDDHEERQSSSGLIVATGTGSTGWASSIARQRGIARLPRSGEPLLAWFVREPFPSVSTGTELDHGLIAADSELWIRSEMENGVIFGDGIESDAVEFLEAQTVRIRVARRSLMLVSGVRASTTAASPDRPEAAIRATPEPGPNDWVQDAA